MSEKQILKICQMSIPGSQAGYVYHGGGVNPTITATQCEIYKMGKHYRIRKLTPLECYRLMGVSDEAAGKMLSANSNTQCYKQAGNSIVVPVLMAIFSQMGIAGVRTWNSMTEDEIYELIERTSK